MPLVHDDEQHPVDGSDVDHVRVPHFSLEAPRRLELLPILPKHLHADVTVDGVAGFVEDHVPALQAHSLDAISV